MKNSTKTSQVSRAEAQAEKAIQRIYKLIENKAPGLSEAAKSKLIVECLIEVSEENKHLQLSNVH